MRTIPMALRRALLIAAAAATLSSPLDARTAAARDEHREAVRLNAADKALLAREIQTSTNELALAALAQRRATGEAVKRFAARITADHRAYDEALRRSAQAKGVPAPATPSRADEARLERLASLAGPAFDRAFLTEIRRSHAEHVRDLRSEASHVADPGLRRLLEGALEAEARHNREARALQGAVASHMPVMLPPEAGTAMQVIPPPASGTSRMPVIPPPGMPDDSLRNSK